MRVELFLWNLVRCLRDDDAQGPFGDRGVGRNDERLVAVGAAASQFDVLLSADDLEPKALKNAHHVWTGEERTLSPPRIQWLGNLVISQDGWGSVESE
jgi:hypothetical protein